MLLLSIPLIAQRESGYQNNLNYAPSTPEVASLGKFIETPVSLYSGIPNVSIPIGSVSSGNLSLPVSLSYHAGGVKVEETASWTGLGWSLSSGGSVTRVVRGIADDGVGGFLNTTKTVEDFLTIQFDASQVNQATDLITRAVNGELDYEPDMYHYNIPGYSGSFFFRQSGQIVSMPHTDVRINYQKDGNKRITTWFITAPNGVKYYFGVSQDGTRKGHEALLGSVSLGGGKNFNAGYINGWKLMDIEDAISKNYIRFTYVENTYDTCSASGQQRYVNVKGEIDGQILSNGIKPITYYESMISSSKISSIESQNGTIEFIKNTTERLDQPGDYSLKEIIIKDLDGKEVKKFNLTYNTVGEVGNSHAVPCSGNDRYYRMFLTSVQQSKGQESLPPYSMQYNSTPLPDRFSLARDLWGYYNGKHSNTSLIPSVTLLGIRYEGADRSANSDFAKAGILEKLTHPTKGYTVFGYEGNTIGQLAFANDIAPRVQHSLVTVGVSDIQNSSEINKPFTISPGEIVQDFAFIDVTYPCDISQRTCGIQLELIKSDGSPVALATDSSVILPPGNYSIQGTITRDDSGNYPDFRVRVYGEKLDLGSLTTDGVNYEVGGLRVKNIKKYDTDTSYFEKSYEYLNWESDNTTSSSGGITSTPFFIERKAVFSNGTFATADIISSSSNNPMTTTKSSYVGYRNVTEYFGTKENNTGKKEYKFSFNLDDDSDIDRFPFTPPVVLEWLRGNLEQERTFKRESNGYTIVKETINQYKYLRNQNDIFKKEVVGVKMGMRYGFWSSKKYYTLSEWYTLEKTTTKDYFKGKEVVTAKELNYHDNANKHVFPVEEVISTNENEWYYNRSKYPEDLTSKTAAEQKLVDYYRINTPIEKITTRKKGSSPEEIVSKEYFDYKIWEGGKVLPEKIRAAKANTPLKDRVIYHKYDDKGNPLEVSLADGSRIMYIWGYNNTQPIVKIANASYTGIPATATSLITQLQTASNTEDTAGEELTMRNLFKDLREHIYFKNAEISGYTYDPLVGVTSMTDPEGYTMYYQYDALNRLQYTLDQEQYIAQQLRYNYQGQQSDVLRGVRISFPSFGSVQPNQAVTFTANTSGSGGANLYTWSVNGTQEQCDSTTSFTKTFASEGTYTISVLAYNTQTKHRVSTTINVVVAYPPITIPVLSANYTHVITGTNVNFSASGIGGGTGDLRYEWYVNNAKQASTATTFTYTTNTAAAYNVYFKVIDNRSGKSTDSEVRLLHVYNPLNTPTISASKAHIVQGTTTTFTASGIGGGSGSRSYEWYVNDVKQSATGTTYSYHFPNSGTYTIKFKVIDLTLQNANSKWGSNAPVLKSYPGMVANSSQSHTSISGTNPSVSFSITSLTGGSGNSQITWKAYNSINLSQALGSGSGTNFGFSNFATGTHEYTIQAKIKDNLTGQEITKVMIVVATVSTDTGGGGGNTGEQH